MRVHDMSAEADVEDAYMMMEMVAFVECIGELDHALPVMEIIVE